MTISIWRYSHLALAVSSFVLLALAALTGIILSFEPVIEKTQPFRAEKVTETTLAEALPVIRKKYPDISELSVDEHQFVKIKASDENGDNLEAFIDPATGEVLGKPKPKSEFFEWVRGLHRSLFLHETGRFLMGLTAFLLLLIAISGIMLLIKRQQGVPNIFKRIAYDGWAQYYHVTLGRLSLILILVIAATGTYLSLVRFKVFEEVKVSHEVNLDAIRTDPQKRTEEIPFFKQTRISDIKAIEFPFSEDAEDYFTIKLADRELTLNQVTGDILTETPYSKSSTLAELSLDLHTGRTNSVWAILLAVAAANILFFIYSGFAITFKRRRNLSKNRFSAGEARFVILVGSENGTTFSFAKTIHEQLLKLGERSFLCELNDYKQFASAEYLLVLTSTYGLGDAPANASKFFRLLSKYPQQRQVMFSVLGFGSHAYPDFCRFAHEVNNVLTAQEWSRPLLEVHTVNDKSPAEFNLWAEALASKLNLAFKAVAPDLITAPPDLTKFTVVAKTISTSDDSTFLVRFKAKEVARFRSGDLFAIYPANDHRERLYSIGRIGDEVQLSVKVYQNGLGSGFLNQLSKDDELLGRIVPNQHFYFPKRAERVILISNGTGIAPFLGMIDENVAQIPVSLYCGFRDKASFSVFQDFLEQGKAEQKLESYQVALSREGEKEYVSKLIERDADLITQTLQGKGVIMLCGSLSMQKDVIALLDKLCLERSGKGVSYYQSREQILMDCY